TPRPDARRPPPRPAPLQPGARVVPPAPRRPRRRPAQEAQRRARPVPVGPPLPQRARRQVQLPGHLRQRPALLLGPLLERRHPRPRRALALPPRLLPLTAAAACPRRRAPLLQAPQVLLLRAGPPYGPRP